MLRNGALRLASVCVECQAITCAKKKWQNVEYEVNHTQNESGLQNWERDTEKNEKNENSENDTTSRCLRALVVQSVFDVCLK
jgi:hypothetical protein